MLGGQAPSLVAGFGKNKARRLAKRETAWEESWVC